MFLSLIKVTGIGPKSALAILASSTPHEVKLAIENENDAYLTQFPGIGKKTARQIVLDLKGRLQLLKKIVTIYYKLKLMVMSKIKLYLKHY